MANSFVVSRNHLILGVCLPIAVLMGYLLAEPLDSGSLAVLVLIGSVLLFPLLLKCHHTLLILSWNASIMPFFLPGRPALWMLMAGVSLFFAVLERSVNERKQWPHAATVTWSLLGLLAVVMITAFMTGGFGSRIFGSDNYGGRGYFFILAAVTGYFALTSQAIPRRRVSFVVAAYFLMGATAVVSNLVYVAGPNFYFLYELFPTDYATGQAAAEGLIGDNVVRITGLVLVGQSVYGYLLARYGLRGIFDLSRPWRLGLLLLAVFFSFFGGYRSGVVLFGIIMVVLFMVEGLWRTRYLWTALGVGLAVGVLLVCFVDRTPMSVQRTLSFLPVNVDPAIKQAARDSTEWRLAMWRSLWPEVPQYLFKGKGYALDPQAMFMLAEASMRGGNSYEWAAYTGDYHNGLLSLLIPFGLYGVAAFGFFLWAGIRVLRNNYLYGAPWLRQINGFLLAFFIGRALFFFLVFGAFYSELFYFTGTLGLSVALNDGECCPDRPGPNSAD